MEISLPFLLLIIASILLGFASGVFWGKRHLKKLLDKTRRETKQLQKTAENYENNEPEVDQDE